MKRFILLVIIPLLAATIGGWFYLKGGRYVETDDAYIKADKLTISPQVSGVVKEVLVSENQQVRQGQPLFTLDPATFLLEIVMGGKLNVPIDEQLSYLTAYATARAANLNLEHTTVYAPIAGIATQLPITGQYLNVGSAALALVSSSSVWIEANIPETDLTYVRKGQPVSITVDMYPDLVWQGEVDSVSPATGAEFSIIPAQNATGNWVKIAQRLAVQIRLAPDKNQPALPSGLSTVVDIDTGHQRKLFGWSLGENATP